MQCPKCNRTMEHGYLHAGAPVVWSTEEVKMTKLAFEKIGDIRIRSKVDELLSPACDEAYVCRQCRMIVMRY